MFSLCTRPWNNELLFNIPYNWIFIKKDANTRDGMPHGPQSKLAKPLICSVIYGLNSNLWSIVLLRYLSILFTATQYVP